MASDNHFSNRCFPDVCKQNIYNIVRAVLAALSVNRLHLNLNFNLNT